MKRGRKKYYTEIFLNLIGEPLTKENIKKYGRIWWHDQRSKATGGLRLSEEGYRFLKSQEMEIYKVKLSPNVRFTGRALLTLDKYLNNPYYIDKKYIYLTTQRNALEFILISGDIEKYSSARYTRKKKK